MLDLYRQLKTQYKDFVLIFKSGVFYVAYDEDAIVLNKIFNYKLNQLKNNLRVGFPNKLLNKNIDILNNKKINYIIIEDKKIILKKKFKFNNFNKYSENAFNYVSVYSRINNISEFLMKLSNNKNIDNILNKIEDLING